MAGNPYTRFFWSDWQSDPALRVCSLAAQGLWMRMLCVMAEAEPRGHLVVGKRPCSMRDLARIAGEDEATVTQLVAELERANVFSRVGHGKVIANRRMIRDEKLSKNRAKAAENRWEKARNPSAETPNENNALPDLHMQTASKPPANAMQHPMQPLEVPLPVPVPESISRTVVPDAARANGSATPSPFVQAPPDPPPDPAPTTGDQRPPPLLDMRFMPPRNARPQAWRGLADSWQRATPMSPEIPCAGAYEIPAAVELVCQDARIADPTYRTDWSPLIRWLREGIDLHDVILPTIRSMAARPDYTPPRWLSMFDGAVRRAAARRHAA